MCDLGYWKYRYGMIVDLCTGIEAICTLVCAGTFDVGATVL